MAPSITRSVPFLAVSLAFESSAGLVSSSTERIEQAKRDWRDGRYPRVPGDDVEFIPLPE